MTRFSSNEARWASETASRPSFVEPTAFSSIHDWRNRDVRQAQNNYDSYGTQRATAHFLPRLEIGSASGDGRGIHTPVHYDTGHRHRYHTHNSARHDDDYSGHFDRNAVSRNNRRTSQYERAPVSTNWLDQMFSSPQVRFLPYHMPNRGETSPYVQNALSRAVSLDGRRPDYIGAGYLGKLACAHTVTYIAGRQYGLPVVDSVAAMENVLQRRNFASFRWHGDVSQLQPGDIVVGHRAPGYHGHTGFYIGNGRMIHSNAITDRIQSDSVLEFARRAPGYRGYAEALIYRPRTSLNVATAS